MLFHLVRMSFPMQVVVDVLLGDVDAHAEGTEVWLLRSIRRAPLPRSNAGQLQACLHGDCAAGMSTPAWLVHHL